MDITSDHPYWFIKNGLIQSYPALDADRHCDVAVIGAGITGAMLAERVSQMGRSIIVLDGRDVGLGSTSASTALLQYEIDLMLIEMAKLIGLDQAEQAYRLSHQSIDQIDEVVSESRIECGFRKKSSIFLAANKKEARLIAEEALARQKIGLDVRYLTREEVKSQYSIDTEAALLTHQAASCDAYRLCHGLLKTIKDRGAEIYDRTKVNKIQCHEDHVDLITDRGPTIHAKKVIIATGYESQLLLKEKVVDLQSTYALVSAPLEDLSPWDESWMMWEKREPYLYLRVTDDKRLLVGGEDDPFRNPKRRDASLPKKVRIIEQKVRKLLPELQWETEFAWAGTFGKTKDGLAFIGPTKEYPGCYFALGFGGNGITFSCIARDIIASYLEDKPVPEAEIFRFGR
jgi:glycine/D-amino acid oxidase-like deaminating enzyme